MGMSELDKASFWFDTICEILLGEHRRFLHMAVAEGASYSPPPGKSLSRAKKIGQALGAWPMPLNGVSPVVPFFPSSFAEGGSAGSGELI